MRGRSVIGNQDDQGNIEREPEEAPGQEAKGFSQQHGEPSKGKEMPLFDIIT